ncbi:hypothetical protein [Candidatus Accumulibacter meliphilus]|jgi:phosphoribosylformylglycinamidine synthase|uniref:hypothetical protein n=1 Tax=Candidatus Accumulibacter meliphilus TaxID=2211374 RepID=UPI003DA861B9
MMFAQANSEHCRHKIFNASWVIDGQARSETLFGMIRETHQAHPAGTVVAYSDNSSVIEGAACRCSTPGPMALRLARGTDAHPGQGRDAQPPDGDFAFSGAATGSGGEIRDEGATGRGSKPKAGLCGFSVSNLNIPVPCSPGKPNPPPMAARRASLRRWRSCSKGRSAPPPSTTSSAARIWPAISAPTSSSRGSADSPEGRLLRGYHKPIMLAGGVGNIAASQSFKSETLPAGTC